MERLPLAMKMLRQRKQGENKDVGEAEISNLLNYFH